MMDLKKRLADPILAIGIDMAVSEPLARRIRQTNFLATIACGVCLLTALMDFYAHSFSRVLLDFVMVFLFALPLLFNRLRLLTLSRVMLLVLSSLVILAVSLLYGPGAGTTSCFFILVGAPFALLLPSERRLTVLGVAFPAAIYFWLENAGQGWSEQFPHLEYPSYLPLYCAGLTFFFVALMMFYFQRVSTRSERLLEDSLHRLQSASERASGMLRAIPDGALRVSLDGNIIDYHRPDSIPFAWPPDGFQGHRLLEVAGPISGAVLMNAIHRAIATGELQDVMFRNGTKQFEARCVRCGSDEAMILTRDMSVQLESLRIIDQQRAMMVSTATRSALGEMAATIAHEIANPLTIIRGHSSQIRESVQQSASEFTLPLSQRLTESADKITKMTERIVGIVRSVRTLARNGGEDPFQNILISKVVADAVDLCRERYRASGVELRVETSPDSLSLDCRHVQIAQVLVNLLNNAFDAVNENPAAPQERWIAVVAVDLGGSIEISVTDSGGGFSIEARAQIFRPFFTTKEVGKGTGLGLSVSREIAERHGGDLQLDENSLHTRFVLTLPKVHIESIDAA